jgi:hypothetical protein
MTDSEPEPAARRRTLNVTLRIGETVAVLGLALAAASFFVGRADRQEEARARRAERAAAVQTQTQEQRRAAAAAALVLRATVDGKGERLLLEAANPGQVIQTQRYIFPRAVREQAREIGAGRPQIERDWVEDGLLRERRALADAGVEPSPGEQRLPVAVVTTFIEAGQTRTDRALYRLGYGVSRGTLGRSRVELQGLSLLRRTTSDDLQAQVDTLWAQGRPAE